MKSWSGFCSAQVARVSMGEIEMVSEMVFKCEIESKS